MQYCIDYNVGKTWKSMKIKQIHPNWMQNRLIEKWENSWNSLEMEDCIEFLPSKSQTKKSVNVHDFWLILDFDSKRGVSRGQCTWLLADFGSKVMDVELKSRCEFSRSMQWILCVNRRAINWIPWKTIPPSPWKITPLIRGDLEPRGVIFHLRTAKSFLRNLKGGNLSWNSVDIREPDAVVKACNLLPILFSWFLSFREALC